MQHMDYEVMLEALDRYETWCHVRNNVGHFKVPRQKMPFYEDRIARINQTRAYLKDRMAELETPVSHDG